MEKKQLRLISILENFGYYDIYNGSGNLNDKRGILMITFYVLIAQLLL